MNILRTKINPKALIINKIPPTTRKDIIKFWECEVGDVNDVLYHPVKATAQVFFKKNIDQKTFQKMHIYNGRALQVRTSYFPDTVLMEPEKINWFDAIA